MQRAVVPPRSIEHVLRSLEACWVKVSAFYRRLLTSTGLICTAYLLASSQSATTQSRNQLGADSLQSQRSSETTVGSSQVFEVVLWAIGSSFASADAMGKDNIANAVHHLQLGQGE